MFLFHQRTTMKGFSVTNSGKQLLLNSKITTCHSPLTVYSNLLHLCPLRMLFFFHLQCSSQIPHLSYHLMCEALLDYFLQISNIHSAATPLYSCCLTLPCFIINFHCLSSASLNTDVRGQDFYLIWTITSSFLE